MQPWPACLRIPTPFTMSPGPIVSPIDISAEVSSRAAAASATAAAAPCSFAAALNAPVALRQARREAASVRDRPGSERYDGGVD